MGRAAEQCSLALLDWFSDVNRHGSSTTLQQFRPLVGIAHHHPGLLQQFSLLASYSAGHHSVDQSAGAADRAGAASHRTRPSLARRQSLEKRFGCSGRSAVGRHLCPYCLGFLPLPERSACGRRSAGWAKSPRFHARGFKRPTRLPFAIVVHSHGGFRAPQGCAAGLLSWILVTVLQPRVTRHPEKSPGISGCRRAARCHQR